MPIFNVIAAYLDDAGVYEWEGEAESYDDALAAAQRQAFEDNCPTAVAEDDPPSDMLDADQVSICDVTERYALKAEVLSALRVAAVAATSRGAYLRDLADRFEQMGTHS